MIEVSKADLLTGLKRCKRIAKQDFLASDLTPNPSFWQKQAQARREKYDSLISLISNSPLDDVYQSVVGEYEELPTYDQPETSPELRGYEQAMEMFLQIVGVDKDNIAELRKKRRRMNDQENCS